MEQSGFPQVGEKKFKDFPRTLRTFCGVFKDPFYRMFGIIIHLKMA